MTIVCYATSSSGYTRKMCFNISDTDSDTTEQYRINSPANMTIFDIDLSEVSGNKYINIELSHQIDDGTLYGYAYIFLS